MASESHFPAEGTVYWITGLSGAGKSTIGQALAARLRDLSRPVVWLDGDALRLIFPRGDQFGQSDRLELATRYGHLCREIASQGIDVVCCTISMFSAVRQWNRDNIPCYVEVYLRVPFDELYRRDFKGIYVTGGRNVVGVDIEAELPQNPTVTIDNYDGSTPEQAVDQILAAAPCRLPSESLPRTLTP